MLLVFSTHLSWAIGKKAKKILTGGAPIKVLITTRTWLHTLLFFEIEIILLISPLIVFSSSLIQWLQIIFQPKDILENLWRSKILSMIMIGALRYSIVALVRNSRPFRKQFPPCISRMW